MSTSLISVQPLPQSEREARLCDGKWAMRRWFLFLPVQLFGD